MIAPGEPLIKVDVGLSAGAVVDKEFLGAGGPGETPDRTAGQAPLLAVPADRPLDRLGEVVPQVPAVRDLDRVRSTAGAAVGVDPGPVPADHLSSRPGSQPRGERIRRALVQDVGRAPGLDVNQQRAVTAPLRSANSSTPSTRGETLTVGSGIARTRRISVIRLTPAAAGYCRLVPSTRFVVQLHDATTLHFDLRIQAGEVLRSWAVPKGPSLDPAVRRLAVPVEDHELSAGEFEGVQDGQLRGSGAVIIWDEGLAEITRDKPGHLAFTLNGSKLAGGFALTRTGERRWILVKTRDATARPGSDIVAERPESARTGRTWEEVATEAGPSTRALRSPRSGTV
jgi:DNA ligase D-like protein (predicted 3'-phosphoesterase)